MHAEEDKEDQEVQEGSGIDNGSPGSNRSNRSHGTSKSKQDQQQQRLSLTPLTTADRRRLEAVIHKYAARAQRTLALGHKQLSARETTTLLQKYCASSSTANGDGNEGGGAGNGSPSVKTTGPSSKASPTSKASPSKSSGGARAGGRSASLGGGEALLSMTNADWDELDLGLTLDLIVGIQVPKLCHVLVLWQSLFVPSALPLLFSRSDSIHRFFKIPK